MIEFRKEISEMKPYIPGRPIEMVKKEFGLKRVIKLASNENPYGLSEIAKGKVVEAVKEGELYPDGSCNELRECLAKKYGVNGNEIIFGCGTDEVIAMIGKVFVNAGDECITAETTFSQYAASVVSLGGKMVYTKMREYGFDMEEMLGAITDKTKIIFIANPNNPTGTVHSNEEQLRFLERVPSNILVVIDEAYVEFACYEDFPQTLEHMKKYKNVMLLKTFSKAYGLAGLRVGYGIADKSIIELFEKIRCPFNVTSLTQVAAIGSLLDEEFLAKTVDGNRLVREFVSKKFEELGLYYIKSYANFIMVDVKKDSVEFFQKLMEKGFIIRPGSAFKMDTFLRVSLGTMEQMVEFCEVFEEILGK